MHTIECVGLIYAIRFPYVDYNRLKTQDVAFCRQVGYEM